MRHRLGDWGEVNEKQWLQNDLAVENYFPIAALYRTREGIPFWITTDGTLQKSWVLPHIDAEKKIAEIKATTAKKEALKRKEQQLGEEFWRKKRLNNILSLIRGRGITH